MAKAKKIPLIGDFDNIPAEALVPEEEWPHTIPKNWKWVRLGYVCAINPPKPKVTAYPSTTKVNFIPMACVSELCGSIVKLELRSLEKVSKGYTSFSNNDVILAKITPCFENGKSAVVPKLKYGFGYGSTEFHVLRCGKLLDPRFLHVLVRQPKFIVQGRAVMTGAVGQQRVPRAFLENYPFPLPPIDKQREIVTYLDKKLGKIDSVREKLKEFLDQADMRKDNLIQAGVTGHLTSHWREEHKTEIFEDIELAEDSLVPEEEWPYPIPPHWKWVILGSVIQPMKTRKPAGETFTYIDIESVNNKQQIVDFPKTLVSRNAPSRASRAVHSGDTLFSLVRPYLRNVAFVTQKLADAIASTGFYVCTPAISVHSKYLFHVLRGNSFVASVVKHMKGDNSPSVKVSDFKMIPFPLPPVAEQKEIVALLENYLEKESASKKLVFSALKQLDLMRQQLVSAALAGRLTTVLS